MVSSKFILKPNELSPMKLPERESLPRVKRETAKQALKNKIIMSWEKISIEIRKAFLFGRNNFV